MALSTNQVSGLASGFDWRTMIDQLIAVDHRRVDLVDNKKSEYESKLSAWQSFNTKLLALKTAAEGLKDAEDFYVYSSNMSTDSATIEAEDLLSVSTSTTAAPGSYTIKVTNLATAQKLSSNPFTSKTAELGSAYAGDLIINGKVITVTATDSLSNVANTINAANTGENPIGATATIVNYGANDYRLILTSDSTGEDGLTLLNGSSTNLVQKFGWKDNQATAIKNTVTNGAQSDRFFNPNVTMKSLLGLATGEASTGTLKIGGTAVTINLSTMSLTGIKTAINDATIPGVAASVVSETVDGTTYYRLQIEGTQTFVDEKNILNTLGILDHTSTSVTGKVSANSMTTEGALINQDTLLVDIDGYISYTAGDNIQMTGTKTGGGAVNYTFNISASTTVSDLLSAIETQYATTSGDVIAYVTSEGKIRVDDVAGGGSLAVTLADNISSGQLEFVNLDAAFSNSLTNRQREIVEGKDAALTVDGVDVTSSDNSVEDVITGVTLNLVGASAGTTVTLNITHDIDAIKEKVQSYADTYNEVISYINTQFSYDQEESETGGVLFGDGTLSSVKSDLLSVMTQQVWGVDSDFSIPGLVGIHMDKELVLSIDDDELTGYLETNFSDIVSLFAAQGTTDISTLAYVGHTGDTMAGKYKVHIQRAATQGTETGTVDLSVGGAGETLTITQGSSSAAITITAAMNLADIKNAINAEMDAEYAETLVGDQQLLEGGSAITADTHWADIDGTTLANENIISFTGTNRTGAVVSGSYTITSVGTDTVRGLLSAIEEAFSNDVTATIDTSGRIVLTDRYAGNSQLSLDITEPVGKGLNFGTIDVTAGAGDGSLEGRQAIAVTATDDGSNHLVLQSEEYGDSSFTISQDSIDNNYDHIVYTTTSNTTAATSGAVYITGQAGGSSGTAWTDIYGATVSNGETITISGKDHDGVNITSANYTINTAADTVDDLLSDIRTAFGGAAAVDVFMKDGKIYLEDKESGSSLMELSLTYNGAGTLSLGTFNQTTKRDLDLGLINGAVTGQDVAGTINGEAATGSGRVLTGNEGNATTDGLSVSYSGSSNDVDPGYITLTLGVAELSARTLFNMTDSIDGYVAFKQDSLQDGIANFETQIANMEARLESKTEMMIRRFVAMELALSRIQNLSSWLTGQINAAANGWS